MNDPLHAVVYDCVIFAQALINPDGPAGECVNRAREGRVRLFVSNYVVGEIRELPEKIPTKYGVTREQVDALADDVCLFGILVNDVPAIYHHPIDPDDSAYINLAAAASAAIIVSRDRHLLNLMDASRPEGQDFGSRYPALRVLSPEVFVRQLRAEEQQRD